MVSFSIQEEPEEDNHDVIIPVEQLARDIEKEIERCKTGSRSNSARRSCCIYNVPLSYRFKNNDDSSYRPRSVSIGPYCYDDKKLDGDYKYQCLDFFLSRTHAKGIGLKLEDFMEKLHTLEGQARACYSEKIDLKSGEFLKMMVVDASFILGLFYKFQDRGPFQTVEPLKWRLQYLYEDLLLFQNQIPFFVLQELFNISKKPDDPSLYLLALQFFNNVMRRPKAVIKRYAKDLEMSYADPQNRPLHLLDLVRSCLIPSNPNLMRSRDEVILFDKLFENFVVCLEKLFPSTLTNKLDNILEYVVQLRFLFKRDEDDDDTRVQFIPCISRLRRSGIRVRPSNAERLLEVKFEYGVIKMPSITMDDFMISLLLNCLAFEQFHGSSSYPKYVTVYATFLDCLVNTTEDVQYLRDCNIIDNSLAEDDTVAQFINSLGKDLNFGKGDFYLDKVFNAVDKYYRKRFNVQRASFKHKYLNSPWSCISVLAATVLLLLTLAQTVFTILAYAHPQK